MGSTRSRTRRVAAATTLALIASMVGLVAGAPTAGAATIVVSTTADGGPGSLRTAIDAANAAAAPTAITLASGATYDLTQCGTGPDDTNTTGDLDLGAVHPVTIQGNGATIHQTCANRRVLDHRGTGLLLQGVTLTGGNAATTGPADGPDGLGLRSEAALTMSAVTVTDNSSTLTSGGGLPYGGSGDAVHLSGTGAASLDHVTVSDNGAAGVLDESTGGTLTVSDSAIERNLGVAPTNTFGDGGGLSVQSRDATVTRVIVTGNAGAGSTFPPAVWPPRNPDTPPQPRAGGIGSYGGKTLTADHVTIRGNHGFEVGGIRADNLVLTDSLVEDNWALTGGVAGGFDVRRTTIRGNHGNRGGGFYARSSASISDSTIEGNDAAVAIGTFEGYGGAGAVPPNATVSLQRSTVSGNTAVLGGGVALHGGSLLFDQVTLAGNSASGPPGASPKGRELWATAGSVGPVVANRSIIGIPGSPPSLPVCDLSPGTFSTDGRNVFADTSCTTQGPDAVGVDPLLGPLTDNGGPTATRVPAPLSPARDRIPASDPACAGTDQRGVARPQGPGCDAGAVEAHLGGFVAQPPVRVVDTRDGTGVAKGPISGTVTVDLPSMPAGTTAAVVNVTADRPTAESFLSISPPGTNGATAVSNLNFPAGRTIANLVTVPIVDPAHPELVVHNNSGATHVIVDLAGTYRETEPVPTGDRFTATSPKRILDTRPGTTVGGPAAPFGPGETRTVAVAGVDGIPADITAVAVNLTVTQTTAASHLTAGPTGAPLPQVSNLNWPAGDTIANQAIVPVGPNGAILLRNNAGQTQVIADVAGWFRASGGAGFRPVTPTRILDTRPATPIGGAPGRLGPGGVRTLDSPLVPTDTTAVVANLTGALPTATTHLTAWPTGTLLPTASNLNLPVLTVRPVLATVAVDAQGRFDLRNNSGFTDALADLQGYYG